MKSPFKTLTGTLLIALSLLIPSTVMAQNQSCDPVCVLQTKKDNTCSANPSRHAVWIPGIAEELVFHAIGEFTEMAGGTAMLTGEVAQPWAAHHGFFLSVQFSGYVETGDPVPSGSPKLELKSSAYVSGGGSIDPSTWSYYTNFTGTLIGFGKYQGAEIQIAKTGPAFQVGVGASGKTCDNGISGWFTVNVVSQPSNGPSLQCTGSHGDINMTMLTNCVTNRAVRPGNQDDLVMQTGINGAAPSNGPGEDVKIILPNDVVTTRVLSPGGTFDGLDMVLAAACWDTCLPPFNSMAKYGLPAIYTNPEFGAVELISQNGIILRDPEILTGGSDFAFPIPVFFQNYTIIMQTFVISPASQNGIYASSDAQILRIP